MIKDFILTYDDVLLEPKYSEILPSETKIETKLSNNLSGYIDSFDRVCRINFVLPSGNNGTRLAIHFVNWHIYLG